MSKIAFEQVCDQLKVLVVSAKIVQDRAILLADKPNHAKNMLFGPNYSGRYLRNFNFSIDWELTKPKIDNFLSAYQSFVRITNNGRNIGLKNPTLMLRFLRTEGILFKLLYQLWSINHELNCNKTLQINPEFLTEAKWPEVGFKLANYPVNEFDEIEEVLAALNRVSINWVVNGPKLMEFEETGRLPTPIEVSEVRSVPDFSRAKATFMSVTDAAVFFNVPEKPLRDKITRWRKMDTSLQQEGISWLENTKRTKGDAQFLYRIPILRKFVEQMIN